MKIGYFWAKFFKKLSGSAIKNSKIERTSKIEAGSQIVNCIMNKHSFCGYNCQIINCHIGSFCSIANNVSIGGAAHPVDWVSMSPAFYEGKDSIKTKFSEFKRDETKLTIIENDVWIGESAIIKQGLTIGNGSVIGMGSVVTKDVIPYSIVAGNPAKIIRMRFSDEIIQSLSELKFWNFDDEKLKKVAKYIKNPQEFIEKAKL